MSDEKTNPTMADEVRFQEVVEELNEIADKLRDKEPNFRPPPFSPTALLSLLQEHADKFTPDALKQLREMLQSASPEDFKDPETWKGMWFILTYTAKEESKSLLGKATSTVSGLPGVSHGLSLLGALPGAGLVRDVTGMLEGASPKDFMDKDTWTGMWYIINHSLRQEAGEMKRRVLGSDTD